MGYPENRHEIILQTGKRCPRCHQESLLLIEINQEAYPVFVKMVAGFFPQVFPQEHDGESCVLIPEGEIGPKDLIVFSGKVIVCVNRKCTKAIVKIIQGADVKIDGFRKDGPLAKILRGKRIHDRRTYVA